MGGVFDGGVGIVLKVSPRRAAIEKAQSELRQEYDVRDERRRELEFLEKGGNPLDFKFGNAASVSVQSASQIDHHVEYFMPSEARGSFPLTTSPHADSVESSGRPGAFSTCDPNSADNFDAENELPEGERKPKHVSKRNNIAPSALSSQVDGAQNARESEDSSIFRPYARRNRSRPNRDARSSSTNAGSGSSLPFRGGSRDGKGSFSETSNQKEEIPCSVRNINPAAPDGDAVSHGEACNTHSNMELDRVQASETIPNISEDKVDAVEFSMLKENQHDLLSEADAQKAAPEIACCERDLVKGTEQASDMQEFLPSAATELTRNGTASVPPYCFSDFKGDGNQGINGNEAMAMKGLDSELSVQNSPNSDVIEDEGLCNSHRNDDSCGMAMKATTEHEGTQTLASGNIGNEGNVTKPIDSAVTAYQNSANDSLIKTEEGVHSLDSRNAEKCTTVEGGEQNDLAPDGADKNLGNVCSGDSCAKKEHIYPGKPQCSIDVSIRDPCHSTLLEKTTSGAAGLESCSGPQQKTAGKAHEDFILEEAQIIEAKRKRIAELSVGSMPSESCQKSHWGFVLEEMAWLANDFVQERLWKLTAAAQICHRVAFTSQLRVEEQNQQSKLKNVAYTLAKAVLQFWHSVEMLLNKSDHTVVLETSKQKSRHSDENGFSENHFGGPDKETCKEFELENSGKNLANPIRGYAIRFLNCNKPPIPSLQAEAPSTPDRVADLGVMDISWDDHLTEESLFYAVPAGAMEIYRVSIESHLAQCDKTRNGMQEEVDITSLYDIAADFGYHGNICDEEEVETSMYYSHGVLDVTKSRKHDHQKRKYSSKSNSARLYEVGADLPYGHCGTVSQQSRLVGKRPSNNLNVGSIPTKRMRTASRQRVISPFSSGITGVLSVPMRTDTSSGDTNSFQDDLSSLHGGLQMQRSMEVESVGEFEKQLSYDCTDTLAKPKKKKKAKHQLSAYDQGWQVDSTANNGQLQRENSNRRLGSYSFDPNGADLYGQPTAKKPKLQKQLLDNTSDNMAAMIRSIPSPAASQMSNMSNTNRFMKSIAKDRGRKSKSLKISVEQPGSGSPWSPFEDQAVVVLVHDLGPNWELISDAMNSTIQFKCIFRKPKDCKDRHRILMDKGAGDGADSAEDSGSSQSYPSTLPGIPKGSAWQLFQHLQGPIEDDTLKSHFEKIIIIGKKLHSKRNQNYNQDPRQIAAVHNSHVFALSQVCPNNLNRGILTPFDFCDATASSPDVTSLGFQGSLSSGLPMTNQGAVTSVLPPTTANSSLQGHSTVLGNSSPSPPGTLSIPARDGRYSVQRTPLPVDEQQRMQQYNQMVSGKNAQPSNMSVSGSLSGADHVVRMLPGGNGMGMMPGVNRSMPRSRPGFPGMASSSMLNSGSMLSSGMAGITNPVNMHPGTGSGQGNSMVRPREPSHMMQSGVSPEPQRQTMVPELQMQVTQGSSQGISAFNATSSVFSSQTTPTAQTYPGHPHQQHQLSSQPSHMLTGLHHPHLQVPSHSTGSQQHMIRVAKERQMQQRLQQQQFAASGGLIPHIHHRLPTSTSMQNTPPIQPQPPTQPVSLSPLTPSSPVTPVSGQQQQQLKLNLSHHGLNRNPRPGASGLINQIGKHRQRQPQQFQQSGRYHPQQRQHLQSLQQAKLLKSMGSGNMVGHQSTVLDHVLPNGVSVTSGNLGAEKGEQIMDVMHGSGLDSGAGLSSIQSAKSMILPQSSNQLQPQQKPYSGSGSPSSKPLQQVSSHPDNSTQVQASLAPSAHTLSVSHQRVPAVVMTSMQQHKQPQQKQVCQAQTSQQTNQGMLHQNRQVNADLPTAQGHTNQSLNNFCQTSTTTTTATQACNGSADTVPVVPNVVASLRKPSQPSLCDSTLPDPDSQAGSICSPLTNASRNEPKASVSQDTSQRQLPGGMPPQGQQQPLLKQTTLGTASSHKPSQAGEPQQRDQHQLPQQQPSHQQT